MPLSGVAMISDNTAAASSRRLAGSLSAASSGVSANVVAIVVAIINFMWHLFLIWCCAWSTALKQCKRGAPRWTVRQLESSGPTALLPAHVVCLRRACLPEAVPTASRVRSTGRVGCVDSARG